jgi:FAD/FMN-containing dehydrogenase
MALRRADKSISGWGQRPVQPCGVYRPEQRRQLIELVSERASDDPTLIPRGLGRSYGDASLNEAQGVSLQTRLNRMLAFDPEQGIIEVESGVSLAELIETLLPRGFFPPVTPGTKYVTVGGALAADVHGKNHHRDGSIAQAVESFTLLTGTGELLECDRTQNTEAFWATLGGMGLTGVIVSVRLRLKAVPSAYMRVTQQRTEDLDATLESFAQWDQQHQYSVAWLDALAPGGKLGRAVVMRGDHLEAEALPARQRRQPFALAREPKLTVPFHAPSFVLSSPAVRCFNALYYARHKSRDALITHYEPFFYPLDKLKHWNRLYGRRGFIQYQAVLPPEQARDGLVALLEKIKKQGRASFLGVLKSFGEGTGAPLSFPMRGQTLSLDIPAGPGIETFARSLDEVVLDHGGRVFLAKDACLEPATFARMYPQLDRFREIKARLDPDRRFESSLARRLNV